MDYYNKKEKNDALTDGKNTYNNKNKNNGKNTFKIITTKKEGQLESTDFGTIFAAASIAGIPIEISRNIKISELKLPISEPDNRILKDCNAINSLRIIPNVNYKETDFYALFKFKLDTKRRELDIFLSAHQTDSIDDYPFNFHLLISSKGSINFKINDTFSEKITDRIDFNKMLSIWSGQGIRRLRIHNLIESQILTVVPGKIDVSYDTNFDVTFNKLLNIAMITTNDAPYLILGNIEDKIKKLKEDINNKSVCKRLIQECQSKIPKEQTKIFLFLKDEDERILLSTCLGIVPYFINLDFINMKPSNRESKDTIKKVRSRECGINIEKYLTNNDMNKYFLRVIEIFSSEKNPINVMLSEIFNSSGLSITGKCEIKISEMQKNYWNKSQYLTVTFEIISKEIERIKNLSNLLGEGKYIEAIPLMKIEKNKNLENLAFAYYVKGDYEKSLEICEESIKLKYNSVAHFTKGLVYLVQRKYDEAFESYMVGVYLVKPDVWYPVIIENIKTAIKVGKIEENDKVKNILENIELYKRLRRSGKVPKACFCGSHKKFYDCHGEKYKI